MLFCVKFRTVHHILSKVLGAELLVEGKSTAYFSLNGLWLALNEEKDIPRSEIQYSYTHLAFSISIESFDQAKELLKQHNVNILPGRNRDERDKNLFILRILTVINLNFILVRSKTV